MLTCAFLWYSIGRSMESGDEDVVCLIREEGGGVRKWR